MSDINLKNITSFVTGNYRYYKDKIFPLPVHLKEQYYYRLYSCKDDCLISENKRCKECSCPIMKKAFAVDSCNPERFPDLMSGSEWKEYKIKHNINNIPEMIEKVEGYINKNK